MTAEVQQCCDVCGHPVQLHSGVGFACVALVRASAQSPSPEDRACGCLDIRSERLRDERITRNAAEAEAFLAAWDAGS